MDRKPRLQELDGLRGLAALAVVAFHLTAGYDAQVAPRAGLWFRFSQGELGVALFFTLSGFVILMTLERTRGLFDFAYARFTRLYPTYWAAVLLTFAITTLWGPPSLRVSVADAVCNLTMLQHLLGAPHVDGVYWSLQAELFFYAGIAALYFGGGRRWLAPGFLAWMALAGAAQFAIPAFDSESHWLAKVGTALNLPYIHLFGFGVGTYLWHADRQKSGLALMGFAVLLTPLIHGWPQSFYVWALMGLLLLAVYGKAPWLAVRPLLFLGAISYPLYLIHQNLSYCAINRLLSAGYGPNASIILVLPLSLFAAWALSVCVERPATAKLRAIASARRSGSTKVSPQPESTLLASPAN